MKNILDFKAFIFDMDGTLINSEPIGLETFIEISSKFEVEPTSDEVAIFMQSWKRVGDYIPEDDFLYGFAKKNGLKADTFAKEFFEMYLQNVTYADVLPGVYEFLNKIKLLNVKIAVVSASKASQIASVIKNNNWETIFDLLLGEEDIIKHKPDPEGYNKAIKQLGLSAEECVVFEDSKNGVLSAKSSGAYVVGLRAGNEAKIDLNAADAIFDDLSQVRK
jgi:HAD superfamily hydrolase (TIGR01509 family)